MICEDYVRYFTLLVFASQKHSIATSCLDGSVVLEDFIKGTIQKGKHLRKLLLW